MRDQRAEQHLEDEEADHDAGVLRGRAHRRRDGDPPAHDPLRRITVARFACGLAAIACFELPAVAFAFALAGELLERHVYFVAVASPRMPGGLA